MASTNLMDTIYTLDLWGLTDVLLPFLLVFIVTYAIISKGQNNRSCDPLSSLFVIF